MESRCAQNINNGTFRGRSCARPAVAGSKYCAQHNPETVKLRRQATHAKWKAEWAQKQARAKEGSALLAQLGIVGLADFDGTLRISHESAKQLLARLK